MLQNVALTLDLAGTYSGSFDIGDLALDESYFDIFVLVNGLLARLDDLNDIPEMAGLSGVRIMWAWYKTAS